MQPERSLNENCEVRLWNKVPPVREEGSPGSWPELTFISNGSPCLLSWKCTIDNCHLCLPPCFLSLRFSPPKPFQKAHCLDKNLSDSVLWAEALSSLPLNSLGKKEDLTQRELSPLRFHHLHSLRWQGPVAGGDRFFLVQTEDFPELCPWVPEVWEFGKVLVSSLQQVSIFLIKCKNKEGYFLRLVIRSKAQ